MIWIMPAVAVAGITNWILTGLKKIGAVSTGAPVVHQSGTALLLTDLQTVFGREACFQTTRKRRLIRIY